VRLQLDHGAASSGDVYRAAPEHERVGRFLGGLLTAIECADLRIYMRQRNVLNPAMSERCAGPQLGQRSRGQVAALTARHVR
jgi:hypothetical protein